MIDATISEQRRLRRNSQTTATTSSAPNSRLWCTVPSVLPTSRGAVVERLDLHALRQDLVVQLRDLLVHAVEHALGFSPRRSSAKPSATSPSRL